MAVGGEREGDCEGTVAGEDTDFEGAVGPHQFD